MKIIELGNPILRKKAKLVSKTEINSSKFQIFVKNLIKTCGEKNGVGIAAPQVGISKKVFIVWSRPNKRYKKAPVFGPEVVINPKIISSSKQKVKGWEGCLSVPGIRGLVPSAKLVRVEYLNNKGKKVKTSFSNFIARIFQHEFDHLYGIVFLDRTDPKDLVTEAEYKKKLRR